MACFWLHQNETTIDISEVHEVNGITYYSIEITVGNVKWTAEHRYNDFWDLHNVLVANYGLTKDIRPPKKVLRNKSPVLIEERRQGLETYLRNVLNFLKRTMPRTFVQFLGFHSCDIFFLLQGFALTFYFEAESILSSTKSYTFNALQMHAISEVVKNPFPEVEQYDNGYDLCHVLDFCLQLHHLYIEGSASTMRYSNIIPNNLPFELSSFKSLVTLYPSWELGAVKIQRNASKLQAQ